MSGGSVAALTPVAFADLAGWAEDRPSEAFAAFRRSALVAVTRPPKTRALGIDGAALARVARIALNTLPERPTDAEARAFFEAWFHPLEVRPAEGGPFLTGYYEPEVDGSPVPTATFRWPLLARPDDLVDIDDATRPEGMDPSFRFARRLPDGGLGTYPDRAAIQAGLLAGRGLELAWLASPIDVFFTQVQGSGRVRLSDGSILRVAYAGKTGHPYTSIGRLLVERGVAPAEEMTMDRLRAWLEADLDRCLSTLAENRSYVFFAPQEGLDPDLGAVAAAGAPLTPGRSLAVDRTLHTFHAPVFLDVEMPYGPDARPTRIRRLMIAQDTGSAILGPARGDFFHGLGPAAAHPAGRTRHRPDRFVVFAPKEGS